jgi:hypothetical protein
MENPLKKLIPKGYGAEPVSGEVEARHSVEGFLRDRSALACPMFESPFVENLLENSGASEAWKQIARSFSRDGYVVLDRFIEPELVDAVASRYEWMFDPNTVFDGPAELRELLARDPARKQDIWLLCEPVKQLACHARVIELLEFLYGRAPIPFQTLNFLRGTEQDLHSDAMHFSSLPSRFMCGVWVAMEDISARNGALQYIPGSHRWPEMQLNDMALLAQDLNGSLGPNYVAFTHYLQARVQSGQCQVEELHVPKGSALIWAANLLHGGAPIRDPSSTRKSQVTHYYFADCVYYTPAFSNTSIGHYFLRDIHDILRGRKVKHSLNGAPLSTQSVGHGRYRLSLAH